MSSTNTEQMILDAATEEFAKRGFKGARTTDIASKAGVTHAMLHYYFRTKQQLFERVFQEKATSIFNLLTGAFEQTGNTLKERIANGVGKHFDFIRANPLLPHLFITTLSSGPEVVQPIISYVKPKLQELASKLQQELDDSYSRGEISQINITMLLTDILSINIFPFLATPIVNDLMGVDNETWLDMKRAENIETILKRISL